jgi:SWI/SNF-related matrix-associated actin-dependent regulator 1 of chromatin subfamily A
LLFDYQRTGAEWLAGRTAATRHCGLLADEMGLGKSAQALAASDLSHEGPISVIGPSIMRDDWHATQGRFGDIPRDLHAASARRLPEAPSGLVFSSFELTQRSDVFAALRARGCHLVIDEAHYLKDWGSKRTQAILGPGGVAERASRVSFLTGTPAPNHGGELYPLLRFSGLFKGEPEAFVARFCVTRETNYGYAVMAHRNADELRGMLGELMLRRLQQVALPPTDYADVEIDLAECDTGSAEFRELRRIAPNVARRLSAAVNAGSLASYDDAETSTARRYLGALKAVPSARRVAATLDRDRSNKAVLFCVHTAPIALLEATLRPYGVVIFSGDTPRKAVKPSIERFQGDPDCRVAICQMKAAGVGITLTAANYLILVERSWSPADEDQAIRRIVRIGQRRPTFVRSVTVRDSIDEANKRVLHRKRKLIAEIVN